MSSQAMGFWIRVALSNQHFNSKGTKARGYSNIAELLTASTRPHQRASVRPSRQCLAVLHRAGHHARDRALGWPWRQLPHRATLLQHQAALAADPLALLPSAAPAPRRGVYSRW